jgi:hypothetical protein
MGAFLATLVAAAVFSPTSRDSVNPFASAATQALVERAMARQRAQDSVVTDYAASLRYRLTLSMGRRRWGRSAPAAVEEQEARVTWAVPNNLRVDIIGRRAESNNQELQLRSVWDRPWFVARGLTDSIRLFSDDFPAIAPLHPLASSGPQWYRYDLVDSLRVTLPTGRRVMLLAVDVTPAREGQSLVVGRLWLDAETAETVRFSFRYVGTSQWVALEGETRKDSSSSRRANRLVSRLLTLDADLEYSLQEGRYWMPYRQVLSGRVSIPFAGDLVIPFEAVTTFRDYEINTGRQPVFSLPLPDSTLSKDSLRALVKLRQDTLRRARRNGEVPDSLWARDYAAVWTGGRFEIHRAPADSLAAFNAWGDSLTLAANPDAAAQQREVEGELSRMAQQLPSGLTGEKPVRFTYQRTADAFGFNRVQGYSLGAGIGVRLPWWSFTNLYGTVRYGFSDGRVAGRLGVVRNGPGWKLTVDGYYDILDQDPVSPGRNLVNSFNAIFTAHDNADYMLGGGGGANLSVPLSDRLDVRVGAKVEWQGTVVTETGSGVNDFLGGSGDMPPNAPVTEGTFAGGSVALHQGGPVGWTLTADVLGGAGTVTGRAWGDLRLSVGSSAGATLRVKTGVATSPVLPQMEFRAGGINTVRGYQYGTQRGAAFWTAQADVTPFAGPVRPVLFIDAGWAGGVSDYFGGPPLVGGGIGLSIYSKLFRTGIIRFDLSRALTQRDTPGNSALRFDVILTAVR